ncbi:hypothetical protein [Clostridium akagii]|uniref:hypothetical protein n=1 Tax=Clostridium akagii TaxID=91623 RepID=UPI00047D080B|nr:hypothetical protein [Clostridium akagii]
MVILQNVIKIIVGIIGMIISAALLYYFIKLEGKKRGIDKEAEDKTVDYENVNNQRSANLTDNNGEEHVYDTMDLTGGNNEDTSLLDEEISDDTSLL